MKNVIITILAVLVLILGGYLVYDKFIAEKESDEIMDSSDDKEEVTDKNEESSIQVIEFYPDSVAILSDGEVYVNVYGSTPEIDSRYGEGTYQTLTNVRNNYQSYNFDNLMFLNEQNETFKGMKLDIKDVKEIYSCVLGQDYLYNPYGILMLKNDGTVYGISLYSLITGKTSVTQILGLKDIVKFESKNTMGMITYAIDSNGNKYSMYDYVPKDYKNW